jgi:hypothetical protein
LWNEQQQVFGEEIHIYNNDSTIDWVHIINQAMTIEKLDSVRFNQVASKEMFSFFEGGEIKRNEAKGNVYVTYYADETDGTPIGMNYMETTELKMWMKEKKIHKIWAPGGTATMYPPIKIPEDKRRLAGFAWFDYIRPQSKDDVYGWRSKEEKDMLKKTVKRNVPLQRLDQLKK